MVNVIRYSREHQTGILALVEDAPFKARIWDWQFEDPAVCSDFDPVVVLDDERVIGFNGTMPASLKYGEQTLEGLWSCDFYVASTHRGQGVGRIVKAALHEKAPVIMSFGVSPKAEAVLEHLGWRVSPEVRSYRLYRRADSLRTIALMGLQILNWLKGRRRFSWPGRFHWTEELPSADDTNRLWSRVASGYRKIVRRDFAYLDWKYQRHPLSRYRFLIARSPDGGLEAVLVVRYQNQVLRIVDWLGPAEDRNVKTAMVRECCREYRGARQLTATTTDPELGKALCDSGFFRARTRPLFFVYSRLPEDEGCEYGWFLMTGDSDGELLSAAREHSAQGDRE